MGCVKLGTVAAAAVCLAVAVLLPGCSRSTCVEPEVEPEPKIPIMTYAFRQMVPMCMGCDPCWSLYWYFECEGDDVTVIGHWDPRDGGGLPIGSRRCMPAKLSMMTGTIALPIRHGVSMRHMFGRVFILTFRGRYHPLGFAMIYEQVPSVLCPEPNGIGIISVPSTVIPRRRE